MSSNSNENNTKRIARLAAVQGLYQIALLHSTPADVVAHYKENPSAFFPESETGAPVILPVDHELFVSIVTGVSKNLAAIDEMIAGAVDARLSADRVEPLLRSIMRAGVFELHHHPKISAGVIINDYVDVTHSFFDSKEPGFVNAVLDKLSKVLRAA